MIVQAVRDSVKLLDVKQENYNLFLFWDFDFGKYVFLISKGWIYARRYQWYGDRLRPFLSPSIALEREWSGTKKRNEHPADWATVA